MRPGYDGTTSCRRHAFRDNDDARNGDWLAVEAGRPIEDAIGVGVKRAARHRLEAKQGPRRVSGEVDADGEIKGGLPTSKRRRL